MASGNSPDETGKTEKNSKAWVQLAVAAISATAIVIVGYWQFRPVDRPNGKDFVGRVLDAKTEKRLRGAKISLEVDDLPPVIYTDTEGVFRFPLKNFEEPVRIRVEVDGYEKFDRNIKPSSKSGMEEVRLSPISPKKKLK